MTSVDRQGLALRLAAVRQRIADAATAAGRDPSDITLVAVTKTVSSEVTQEALLLGADHLGENRAADLQAKRRQMPAANWHMVGRLQRNKVRDVVDGQTLIHSLDRRSLADAMQRHAERLGVVQPVLVQVNVGDDPAKGGCQVNELGDLVAYADRLTNLRVEGLMTVPPLPKNQNTALTEAAGHFATLRQCRDDLATEVPAVRALSMGMSADLEAAIEQGATMVRVGTDIFGPRSAGPARLQEEQR